MKIYNYEHLIKFLESVKQEIDIYAEARKNLKHKLYKYTDGNSCKRIVEFMGL